MEPRKGKELECVDKSRLLVCVSKRRFYVLHGTSSSSSSFPSLNKRQRGSQRMVEEDHTTIRNGRAPLSRPIAYTHSKLPQLQRKSTHTHTLCARTRYRQQEKQALYLLPFPRLRRTKRREPVCCLQQQFLFCSKKSCCNSN